METGHCVWIHMFSVELGCLRTCVSSVLSKFNIYLSMVSFRMVVLKEKAYSYRKGTLQYSLSNVPQS